MLCWLTRLEAHVRFKCRWCPKYNNLDEFLETFWIRQIGFCLRYIPWAPDSGLSFGSNTLHSSALCFYDLMVLWGKNRVVFSDWFQHGGPPTNFIRWLRYGGALSFHSSAWWLCLPVCVLWIHHSVDWTCSQTLVPHFLAFIDIFIMSLERTNNYFFGGDTAIDGHWWLLALHSGVTPGNTLWTFHMGYQGSNLYQIDACKANALPFVLSLLRQTQYSSDKLFPNLYLPRFKKASAKNLVDLCIFIVCLCSFLFGFPQIRGKNLLQYK